MKTMNSNTPAVDIHAHSLLAATFSHPREVLSSPRLTSVEKRCILAGWASDAFAVEDRPWLRSIPGAAQPVPLAQILDALKQLDEDDDPPPVTGAPALRPPVFQEVQLAVGF